MILVNSNNIKEASLRGAGGGGRKKKTKRGNKGIGPPRRASFFEINVAIPFAFSVGFHPSARSEVLGLRRSSYWCPGAHIFDPQTLSPLETIPSYGRSVGRFIAIASQRKEPNLQFLDN